MVWVKCATCAECKTIRIAESSIMDSWEALLRPMCKVFIFDGKRRSFDATLPTGRHAVVRKSWTMTGYGRHKEFLGKNLFRF